jgi:hypothetical protein
MFIRRAAPATTQAEHKPLYKKEVEDEQLVKRYKEADERLGVKMLTTASFFTIRSVLQQFHAVKESRCFETYNDTQRYLDRYYNKMKLTMGRTPTESLISRSTAFRQKVEKASQSPVSVLNGNQNWYLSLRQSKVGKRRDPLAPIGRSYDGLWVHILSANNKPVVTMRKPECFTKIIKSLGNSFDSDKGNIARLMVNVRVKNRC